MNKFLFLLIFVPTSLSSCILAPAIDSFKQLGVTKSDRTALLPTTLKRFHDSLYWGKPQEAMELVVSDARPELSEELQAIAEDERVVDSKIRRVDFSEDASNAKVQVAIKFFKVPFYIVNERRELQEWTFSVSNGWKLRDRQVEKAKS